MGKIALDKLSYLLRKYKTTMVKDNGIGWDYSHAVRNNIDIIAKIEPMMFYKFLRPEENAQLSFIFAHNDFLTSGVRPEYALVDFEKVKDAGIDFEYFLESMLGIFNERGIKLLSAHTGDYGNTEEGISGSLALLTIAKKPKFGLKRIKKPYKIVLIGELGLEYKFFNERINKQNSTVKISDLSVENYISLLDKRVYYVHDLAEGGLLRALYELKYVLGHGFEINSVNIEKILAPDLPIESALEVSSSGAIIIITKNKFELPSHIPHIPILASDHEILLDGKPIEPKGDIIQELFKNK